MDAYYTCRGPLTPDDDRIIFYGIRYQYEQVLNRRITQYDIDEAAQYLLTFGPGKTPHAWPQELWQRVVDERDGWVPVKVTALPEGTVIYPQVPGFVVTAEEEFAKIGTWLETQLMRTWSPMVTATKSMRIRNHLQDHFELSVDDQSMFLLESRFHDFGGRGVSSQETAMSTGAAHLVAFEGTDTMLAGWLATLFNDGRPIGESVWASEHAVMTSWGTEDEAVTNAINVCPEGAIISIVADTIDYDHFIWKLVPTYVITVIARGLKFLLRPDSGDPLRCVIDGLLALEAAFGVTINSKGYKVLNHSGVIQGDGLMLADVIRISNAVLEAGFSAENVAYGMGGGLLQKQNRDTLKVAIKLCRIRLGDSTCRSIMKSPSTDITKTSLPGPLTVSHVDGIPTVFVGSMLWDNMHMPSDLLKVIYDQKPIGYEWDDFDTVRARARTQFRKMPLKADVFSAQLKDHVAKVAAEIKSSQE
jgi:nicotinamide phosphoribosyltransferase